MDGYRTWAGMVLQSAEFGLDWEGDACRGPRVGTRAERSMGATCIIVACALRLLYTGPHVAPAGQWRKLRLGTYHLTCNSVRHYSCTCFSVYGVSM